MKRSDIHRTAMTAAETQNSSGDSHHERRLVIGHSLNISLRSRIRIERFAHAFLCRESSIVTALTILGTPAALMASHIGVLPDWTWITEIAKRNDTSRSRASSILTLAFLAPEIVEAILDGRQPPEVNLELLTGTGGIPLSWVEQRRLYGTS